MSKVRFRFRVAEIRDTCAAVLMLAALAAACSIHAQSLADAAKKAEENGKAAQTSPSKVYTNKDLPSASVARSGGIQPLTPDNFSAAKAEAVRPGRVLVLPDGRRVTPTPGPLNSPLRIRLARNDRQSRYQVEGMPFGFLIVSPYVAVVDITREAVRRSRQPEYPSIEQLNAALVSIIVTPDTDMRSDVIENAVIRRGDQVIKPLKAVVMPEVLTNGFGARKESASGRFTFDFASFAPDQGITIVLIGRAGNHEWTMPPEELSQLK